MVRDDKVRRGKALAWGFFLIALGGAFLLERFGILDMPPVGRVWPAVFLLIGTIQAIERRFGSALTFVLLSAWFFACEFEWWGFTYRNSWPLLLVAQGAGMVVRAVVGDPPRRVREGGKS